MSAIVEELESKKENTFPGITPETATEREALLKYIPLAEMVAKREMKNLPPHAADFKEIVNIGLIKINALIQEAAQKKQNYNPSYISQSISWEVRNKNRKEAHQRGEHRAPASSMVAEGYSLTEIREAVIDTVISFDEHEFEMTDENAPDPAEQVEINELKAALKQAITLLPDNYRTVIELRFYKGLKGIEIANRLGVSSARVTRMIQDAINLMREKLAEKKLL